MAIEKLKERESEMKLKPLGVQLERQGDNDEGCVGWELSLMGLLLADSKDVSTEEIGDLISLAIERKRIVIIYCKELQYFEHNFMYCINKEYCRRVDASNATELLDRARNGCDDCTDTTWVVVGCILPDDGKNMGTEIRFFLSPEDGKKLHKYLGEIHNIGKQM